MGVLGPHEGKELQLMLARKKQIAFFAEEDFSKPFDQYIQTSQMHCLRFKLVNDAPVYSRIIYWPEYENQAQELLALIKNRSWQADVETRIGELLGYNKDDIQFYLNHTHKYR